MIDSRGVGKALPGSGVLLDLEGISVDVRRKNIKYIHLRVYPPSGCVRISSPWRMSLESLRHFALSKLSWIREQQKRFQEHARENPREFLDLENHWVWGTRYPLKIVEEASAPRVELENDRMILRVRPGAGHEKKRALMEAWYRDQVRKSAPPLVEKWAPILNVQVNRISVRKMRTRWGSCSLRSAHIRFNSRLAEKPRECLEHVVVHELVHLLEPSHNHRFKSLMDQFLPPWRSYRKILKGPQGCG